MSFLTAALTAILPAPARPATSLTATSLTATSLTATSLMSSNFGHIKRGVATASSKVCLSVFYSAITPPPQKKKKSEKKVTVRGLVGGAGDTGCGNNL